MNKRYKTDFLFSEPGFVEGMAHVFDVGGTFTSYNVSKSDKEADYKALKSDWGIVGQDIQKAVDSYAKKIVDPL